MFCKGLKISVLVCYFFTFLQQNKYEKYQAQTEKGGWNGAFKEVSYTESEELLNFSKDNNWEGERSPAVEFRYKAKVDLSFTTNDTRGKSRSSDF